MHDKPLLVMFLGVPGSGKTTFAKKLANEINGVVLASDSMRIWMWGSLKAKIAAHNDPNERIANNNLTFGALNYATNQIILSGHSVIYDCNANHISERQEKYDIANKHGAHAIIVRLSVPYEVSLHRLQTREETHDARQFPGEKAHQVLEQFAADIEEPKDFEKVIEIDGTLSFDEQYKIFKSALALIS